MRAAWATLLVCLLALGMPARAQPVHPTNLYFRTSDGVRLHAIEAGPTAANTIVLVPGWTMPAWIFMPQVEALAPAYRVVVLDPRGQGASEIARSGYTAARRGQDIAELLARLGGRPVLLGGWSLGVLDVLAYIHTHGDARVAGLLLIDNSVGETPWPTPSPPRRGPPLPWPQYMRDFVRGMFLHPRSQAYLDRLTAAALVTPEWAAHVLLGYREPPSYWRDALYATHRPTLYIVRAWLAAQAAHVARRDPEVEAVVMGGVGHAMFVDEPARFNAMLLSFLQRRVWPRP